MERVPLPGELIGLSPTGSGRASWARSPLLAAPSTWAHEWAPWCPCSALRLTRVVFHIREIREANKTVKQIKSLTTAHTVTTIGQ